MNGIKFANVVAFRNWWYKPNYVSFFQNIFLKHVSLRGFYLCMKLLQSSAIFKQRNNREVPCNKMFYNSQIRICNCQSMHGYNRKVWVGIPIHYISMHKLQLTGKFRPQMAKWKSHQHKSSHLYPIQVPCENILRGTLGTFSVFLFL